MLLAHCFHVTDSAHSCHDGCVTFPWTYKAGQQEQACPLHLALPLGYHCPQGQVHKHTHQCAFTVLATVQSVSKCQVNKVT